MESTEVKLIEFANKIVQNEELARRLVTSLPLMHAPDSSHEEVFQRLRVRNTCIDYMRNMGYRASQALATLRELIDIGYMTKESIVKAI